MTPWNSAGTARARLAEQSPGDAEAELRRRPQARLPWFQAAIEDDHPAAAERSRSDGLPRCRLRPAPPPRKRSKAPGRDRLPRALGQRPHVGQVVQGQQAGPGQLLAAGQVVEVGAAVAAAGLARAALDERLVGVRVAALGQVDAEAGARARAPARRRGARGGSGRRSRRRRSRGRCPSAGRRPRRCRAGGPARPAGRWGIVASSTPRISSLSWPSVPPIEIPSTPAAAIASADSRRRSSWTPPWTIPKTAWRSGPFSPCHSRQRSSQRWVRSIERAV